MLKNKKLAIVNIPHKQCEQAAVMMLESVGYEVRGPAKELTRELSGYMKQPVSTFIPLKATPKDLQSCDLFVTVKYYSVLDTIKRYNFLKNKILWFDINGGQPGRALPKAKYKELPLSPVVPYVGSSKWYADSSPYPVSGPRYVCYIPIDNREECLQTERSMLESPVSLVHNPYKWGYGWIVDLLKESGIKFHGGWGAPDGLLPQSEVPKVLSKALCYVHTKGRDCPGYSLYQALLCGCPVIVSSLFLERTGYSDLYEHNKTCLVVDDDPKLALSKRARVISSRFRRCVDRLRDPVENKRIGEAGRERLLKLQWRSGKDSDRLSFQKFMGENYVS